MSGSVRIDPGEMDERYNKGFDDAMAVRDHAENRELQELRKLYGAKVNAITAALGHICEAQEHVHNDQPDSALFDLNEAARILRDA